MKLKAGAVCDDREMTEFKQDLSTRYKVNKTLKIHDIDTIFRCFFSIRYFDIVEAAASAQTR